MMAAKNPRYSHHLSPPSETRTLRAYCKAQGPRLHGRLPGGFEWKGRRQLAGGIDGLPSANGDAAGQFWAVHGGGEAGGLEVEKWRWRWTQGCTKPTLREARRGQWRTSLDAHRPLLLFAHQ